MPVNYANGKIYAIKSYQTDQIYIGSTTIKLSQRLAQHRCEYKRPTTTRYYSSFEIVKYPDAYIELIHAYPCNNKEELYRREGEVILATENCVNKYIAGRTYEEWYEENKDKIRERSKQWYIDNRERALEYHKEYREKNLDEIKEKDKVRNKIYRENNPEVWKQWYDNNREYISQKGKEYRELNKEKISEYQQVYYEQNKDKLRDSMKEYYEQNRDKHSNNMKEYYEQNKDKLLGKMKEYREKNKEELRKFKLQKYTCECGGSYVRCHKATHMRSLKHKQHEQFMTLTEEQIRKILH